MTTAEVIADCLKNSELPFLVIGGLAVIAYGHPRDTIALNSKASEPRRPGFLHWNISSP
jgi:hypothetical protein